VECVTCLKRRAFKPVLTIHMDGNTDLVTVNGSVSYDRSKMDKNQKRIMRRVIVEALFPNRGRRIDGWWNRQDHDRP
jgi:heptaprenylglyceryl phosphate synthase